MLAINHDGEIDDKAINFIAKISLTLSGNLYHNEKKQKNENNDGGEELLIEIFVGKRRQRFIVLVKGACKAL